MRSRELVVYKRDDSGHGAPVLEDRLFLVVDRRTKKLGKLMAFGALLAIISGFP